jgi:hypothetical protein
VQHHLMPHLDEQARGHLAEAIGGTGNKNS